MIRKLIIVVAVAIVAQLVIAAVVNTEAAAQEVPAVVDSGGATPEEVTPRWNTRIVVGRQARNANTLAASKPVVEGSKALYYKGRAFAPYDAPDKVKQVIWAGNKIHALPYLWGGGHGSWNSRGYDCSGSVSYALYGAGLVKFSMASGGYMSWGLRGNGRWITVYANGGHMYMTVAGLRFDTSGANPSRWQGPKSSNSGYSVRHPAGL